MILSGKYEVTEKVGQGGMGIVYRVRHMDLDTVLALKILPRELSQDPDLVERFRREARMMARLNHPNIVRVFDFAKDGDTYYLIMEFLGGRNLRQILQDHLERTRQAMPLAEVLRVGSQIAQALAYAHAQTPAVVHRDIKPSNIIVEDGTERAVVTDFGIAKLMGESQSELTHTGLFVGTVKYCAPEQLRHDADIDARVDVYALGMLLYELYTGKQYFAGMKDHEVIGKVLYEKGDNLVELPDTPPEFNALVTRAIARDRDRRHPTADAVLQELQACLRQPGSGPAVTPAPVVGTDDIEAQIRTLELMRTRRRAEEARTACESARAGAESAQADHDAGTQFAAAVAVEQEGRDLFERGEHQDAAGRLQAAAAAFTQAAEEAVRRRRERAVTQAREAAADVKREALARGADEQASQALARGDRIVAAAEKLASAGDYERAAAEFGEAAEVYGAAIAEVQRKEDLGAIEAALPGVRAARRRAEEAEAPALVPDVFAAAARDQDLLEQALAAEQLTEARELIAKVEAEFTEAVTGAAEARVARAAAAARTTMDEARTAARAAIGSGGEPDEIKAASARETAGKTAEGRRDWKAADAAFREAAALYEKARKVAEARAEAARAEEDLAEARATCEAAHERAEKAGARQGAPTLFGRARDLGKRAATRAKAGAAEEAAEIYRQAAEQYAHAMQVAERRSQREALEQALAKVKDARAKAEAAGADDTASFAAGERATEEAERALAADDLTAGAASAETARKAYLAARAEVERGRHVAEVDGALAEGSARADEARRADAAHAAAAEFRAAEELHARAVQAREKEDWENALTLARDAEKRYAQSLQKTAEAARAEADAAAQAARAAGIGGGDVAAGDAALAAAGKQSAGGDLVAATEGYREAKAAYRGATERTSTAATEARAAAAAARRVAEETGAATHASGDFEEALRAFTAAERESGTQHFGAAVQSYRESATRFEQAATTAARGRLRSACEQARDDATRAEGTARAAGAPEAVTADFNAAARALGEAEQALAQENFRVAETGFRGAATAFRAAAAAAERVAAERETRASRDQARGLRALRDPEQESRGARRKIKRADAAIAHATELLEHGGDLAEARSELAGAIEILEALPPPPAPAPADATSMATVVRPLPQRGARALPVPAIAAGVLLLVAGAAWFLWPAGEEQPATEVATVAKAPAPRPEEPPARRQEAPRREEPVSERGQARSDAGRAPAANVPAPEVAPAAPAPKPEPAQKPEEEPAQVAAVEPKPIATPVPAATAPPPPVIRRVDPEEATVKLEAGSKAAFRVEVADASDVSYRWTVGDEVVQDAKGPTLSVPVSDRPRTVAVVAKNAGGTVEHRWELASLPRATVAAPAIRPPEIVSSSPRDQRVTLGVGAPQRFTVSVKPSDRRLAYAWSLDGRSVGSDAAFTMKPTDEDEGKTRTVKVGVTDPDGKAVTREWSVQVPMAPVRIASQRPSSPATFKVGTETELSVDARVGGRSDVPLTYRWSVDGRRVPGSDGPRFRHQIERPRADVEVTVEAPGRQAAVNRWRLLGETPPSPKPRVEPTMVPVAPAPAPPAPAGNAEAEVQAWIEAYRSAYQEKNVDRLVSLGVLTADNRDRMRRALEALNSLQVTIARRSIDVQGPDRAVVSLTRVDSFVSSGGREEKSIPIEKTLRKSNGRWIAQ